METDLPRAKEEEGNEGNSCCRMSMTVKMRNRFQYLLDLPVTGWNFVDLAMLNPFQCQHSVDCLIHQPFWSRIFGWRHPTNFPMNLGSWNLGRGGSNSENKNPNSLKLVPEISGQIEISGSKAELCFGSIIRNSRLMKPRRRSPYIPFLEPWGSKIRLVRNLGDDFTLKCGFNESSSPASSRNREGGLKTRNDQNIPT
nr:uncharacterized protein LOC109184064 [Ipomoea batatas]